MRNQISRSSSLLIPTLVCMSLLAACQDGPPRDDAARGDEPVAGGTAVVAIPDEPDVLNSLVRTSAVAGMVRSLLETALV